MTFNDLGLSAEILRAVSERGYKNPTPIQQKAIPFVLAQRDVLAGAQTGTGKTAGFVLPLLHRLGEQPGVAQPRQPRALVLTPTRELAAQVADSVRDYGKYLPLRFCTVFGGVKPGPQIRQLYKGADIVIATPGRLLDHVQQGNVDLSQVAFFVLDEADRMLDMGFISDIKKIRQQLPRQRQNLMFSATYSSPIRRLASDLLQEPVTVDVARHNTAADTVAQCVVAVDKKRKSELLSHLIGVKNWRQVLVFTRTKHAANRLTEYLGKSGLPADAIHGNKSQAARTRALKNFKSGKIRVLVATDIAARGLDIDQLPQVVNFELPNVAEDYVHRIGRTGRAGREGEAVSLVCVDEHRLLRNIEHLLKRQLPQETLPGYEVDPGIRAEPIQNGKRRTSAPPKRRAASKAAAGKRLHRNNGGQKSTAGLAKKRRHSVRSEQGA